MWLGGWRRKPWWRVGSWRGEERRLGPGDRRGWCHCQDIGQYLIGHILLSMLLLESNWTWFENVACSLKPCWVLVLSEMIEKLKYIFTRSIEKSSSPCIWSNPAWWIYQDSVGIQRRPKKWSLIMRPGCSQIGNPYTESRAKALRNRNTSNDIVLLLSSDTMLCKPMI